MNKRGDLTIGLISAVVVGIVILGIISVGYLTKWKFFKPVVISENNLDNIAMQCSTFCLINSKKSFCEVERDLFVNGKRTPEKETCYSLSMSKEYSGTVKKCSRINCGSFGTIIGGGGGVYGEINFDSTERTSEKIAEVMNKVKTSMEYTYYSHSKKSYETFSKDCECGNFCKDYATSAITHAKNYGIPDPLLLIAVIIQESECDAGNECNKGEDCGLMQINVNNLCYTEEEDISSIEQCKKNLLNNNLNIKIGAEILKSKYDQYHNRVPALGLDCAKKYPQYKEYTSWGAALRGYNGWGCDLEDYNRIDEEYVEKVSGIYNKLKEIY